MTNLVIIKKKERYTLGCEDNSGRGLGWCDEQGEPHPDPIEFYASEQEAQAGAETARCGAREKVYVDRWIDSIGVEDRAQDLNALEIGDYLIEGTDDDKELGGAVRELFANA